MISRLKARTSSLLETSNQIRSSLTVVSGHESHDSSVNKTLLKDHEYECTRWDVMLESSSDGDSIHGIINIENEVEIEDEPPRAYKVHSESELAMDESSSGNVTNLDIPPSPATATIKKSLQLAYRETQKNRNQGVASYDQNQLSTEPSDIQDLNLDILDEIETSRSPPHYSSGARSGSISSTGGDKDTVEGPNLIQNHVQRRERFRRGLTYICTKVKRMRLRTGATAAGTAEYDGEQYRYASASDSFKLMTARDSRRIKVSSKFPHEIISVDGNDHRYAAQVLTQNSSSRTVRDHQYENRDKDDEEEEKGFSSTLSATELGSVHVPVKPAFEKRTYERNKSFVSHLQSLFSEVIRKLEEQTGAVVCITISYNDSVFTKFNYRDAVHSFAKKRVYRRLRNGANPEQRRLRNSNYSESEEREHKRFRHSQSEERLRPSQSEERNEKPMRPSEERDQKRLRMSHSQSDDEPEEPKPTRVLRSEVSPSSNPKLVANSSQHAKEPKTELDSGKSDAQDVRAVKCACALASVKPHRRVSCPADQPPATPNVPVSRNKRVGPTCVKCNSSTLASDFGKMEDGDIAWIRCSDPLCQYLVHAGCLGFLILSKKVLKTLPPFFCESHRGE